MPKPRTATRREPNGRLSRRAIDRKDRDDMTAAEAKSVAIEARVRHGIPREYADLADAGRPNAGTIHGRMRLRGMQGDHPESLNADQFAAAEWYLGRHSAYLRLIGAPGRPHEPREGPGVAGQDVTISDAIAEWSKVLRVLQDVTTESRSPILAAFDTILVRQCFVAHMVGDLRLGLNAIYRAFLAGARRAA